MSAAEAFGEAVELDEEITAAHLYLGESCNHLGRWEEALQALRRAIHLQPANARAYYVMGIVYDRLQHPDRAADMYRRAREASS